MDKCAERVANGWRARLWFEGWSSGLCSNGRVSSGASKGSSGRERAGVCSRCVVTGEEARYEQCNRLCEGASARFEIWWYKQTESKGKRK